MTYSSGLPTLNAMIIERLRLRTHLPEKQYRFYTQTLGLPGQRGRGGSFELHTPGTNLVFKPYASPCHYHFAFNIPPYQYEPALQWLQERVTVLPDEQGHLLVDFSNWNAYAMYFWDPAGNIVEFIARRDLPESPVEGFSAARIRSVSEIGLPVREVAPASARLQAVAGVPLYSGNQETFSAIGGPEGLFIVVDERKKTWYPTGQPAHPFPVEVRFRENGKRFELQLSSAGLDLRPASGSLQW